MNLTLLFDISKYFFLECVENEAYMFQLLNSEDYLRVWNYIVNSIILISLSNDLEIS
jgi:hypothetical protein